jgi:hypothetical protein
VGLDPENPWRFRAGKTSMFIAGKTSINRGFSRKPDLITGGSLCYFWAGHTLNVPYMEYIV